MSWAQRRKFIYLGTITLIIVMVVGWYSAVHFYQAPTCFDGKQNGTEQGIDCGGSCSLLCPAQYAPLSVLWSRFSKVNDGSYNVLAYVQNSNLNAGANNLGYVFKLYNSDGVLLNERFGQTFAPADRTLAIFEADMQTGNQIPQRVDFSFTTNAIWIKAQSQASGLSISQTTLSREDTAPRLSATISNQTINLVKNIEAVAIVYDANGNTISFSRTILDSLGDHESKTLSFNWPKPFSTTVARTEIVLKILN